MVVLRFYKKVTILRMDSTWTSHIVRRDQIQVNELEVSQGLALARNYIGSG